jgi:type I restriction enzyme M protein
MSPIKEWWNNREDGEQSWKVNIKTVIERNYDLDIRNPHKSEEAIEHSSTELMLMLENSIVRSMDILNNLKEELL